MQLEAFHWKKSQPLAEDYIQASAKAAGLFHSHYTNPEDWAQRAASAAAGPKADRGGLIEALTAYNRRIGNAPAALEGIARLADPAALVVVGGQQAGLFGGELLVLYKAVTIIQLAKEWSLRLNRPVVPVFWIAGEDHDFDEVNHIHYLTSSSSIDKIKVQHPTGQRTAVSQLPLPAEAWTEALAALDQSLIDTEFKERLMSLVRASAAQGGSLSDAFGRWMAALFGEYGLILLDSDDPQLRRLEAPMFEQLITGNEALSAALLQGRAELERAGYEPQAEVSAEGAQLFVFEGGQRLLLQRDDGGLFTDKKKQVAYTVEQLAEMARLSPERLSNNVMTRPLMQQFLFPALATVLGPGEIAYWALTRAAFEQFGMQMPMVAPRLEFTLLEGAVHKHMNKYGLSFEDVIARFEEKKRQWLEAQDTLGLAERFAAVKSGFRDGYGPLVELLGSINPGIRKLGETNMAKIAEQIEYLEAKAADAAGAQHEAGLRQLERIRLTIFPLAKPQERVYNGLAYLNRYGDGWLKQLLEASIPVDGMHRIYYL